MNAKVKELFEKVKGKFDGLFPTAPAAAPVIPVAPAALAGKSYKTVDGIEISVAQAGEAPVIGEAVTAAGVPVEDKEWELEDGTKITTVGGAITAIVPPVPVTQPEPDDMTGQLRLTAEGMKDSFAKFATGTPEERIANLETMVKALFEDRFGWEVRRQEEEAARTAAIAVYKDTMPAIQTQVTEQAQAVQMAKQDSEEAKKEVDKCKEIINAQFELIEEIAKTPSAEPATLTGQSKDRFEKREKTAKKFEKMGDIIQGMKNKANPVAQ